MSASFDISGLSDLSSVSSDIGNNGNKQMPISKQTVQPSVSPRQPVGRAQSSARQGIESSIEVSGSDLSESLEIDHVDSLRSMPMASTSRPANRGKPPAIPVSTRRQQESVSSIELSGSELSESLEIEHLDPPPAAARGPRPSPGLQTVMRPTTSGRPFLVPAPQAKTQPHSRSKRYDSDSFSMSAVSSDDLLADLNITSGGGGFPAAEVLTLDGSKITKTRITRAGRDQGAVRESTHTVVISEPESLLSLSSGALEDGSGSLVIEHSEDVDADRVDKRQGQGTVRLGQATPPTQRPTAPVTSGTSGTIEYDEDLLGSRDFGARGIGSASIEFDASASNDDAAGIVSLAMAGREPAGRQPVAASRYETSKTPSVSGSSTVSSISANSTASGTGRGSSATATGLPILPGQRESLARTTGSVRLSRPQSIGGLTAEPVFASGSSRSGVTPSISSGDGGGVEVGRGGRTSSGSGALGVNLLDASALEAPVDDADYSYDVQSAAYARPSVDFSGGGVTVSKSWDRSERSRGGRRAVYSGGASSSGSSINGSSSSGSLSHGVGGVRLRGIEELAAGDELPEVDLQQPASSSKSGISYSNFDEEENADFSYGDDAGSKAAGRQENFVASPLPQWKEHIDRPPAGGSGKRSGSSTSSSRKSEQMRRARESIRGSPKPSSIDSSLEGFRPPNSTSHLSGMTVMGSGSRGGAGASRYADDSSSSSSSSSRGSSHSDSVIASESLHSISDHGSDSSGNHKHGGRPADSRSGGNNGGNNGAGGSSISSSHRNSSGRGEGADAADGHDLLAGLEMVQESSSSSSSSSSGGEKIMTVDQLMAQATRISDNGIVRPQASAVAGSAAGSSTSGSDKDEYDDEDFEIESINAESRDAIGRGAHSRVLSRTGSSQRGVPAGDSNGGSQGRVSRMGPGQREFSFGKQVGGRVDSGISDGKVSGTILGSGNSSGVESPSDGISKRGTGVASAAISTPLQPRQTPRAVPDPRVAMVVDSASYSSVEEDDEFLMAEPVRLAEDAGWTRLHLQQSDALSSDHSSPSLSREDRRGRRHHPTDAVDSPSGTFDASASHLSQSGALGVAPVAPGWATISAGGHHDRGGRRGGAVVSGYLVGMDPNQISRDSDLSEEFIPSEAMQRGLPEQPIFRPLMPNVPTPRASTGALGTVPAFTARGVVSGATSRSPSPSFALSPSHSQKTFPDPQYHPKEERQRHTSPLLPPRPPPEPLSPAVALAAAPPPPRQAFAATQTDVYTHVVDLNPMSRPGTLKLRTVAVQWGTLNEVSTQVAFDPVVGRLVDASAGLHDMESLPPHLRRQLQTHLLQQQQLYGPFSKRGTGGAASGLLQAGADSLLLGDGAPLSGIGPGFGILSLAFHSVKTAAMLEQLERSLSSAATVAGVTPPPAYTPHLMTGAGAMPFNPYGWWPTGAPPSPPMTPGQAAVAAYAAAAAAAQPPSSSSHPTSDPAPPSPQRTPGAGDDTTATVAEQQHSGRWPTLMTVASPSGGAGAGGGASGPTSPLSLTLPSRLRSMSVAGADINSTGSSAVVMQESSSNLDTVTSGAAAAIRGGVSRLSRLSSSGIVMGNSPGAGGLPNLKRTSSPAFGAYGRSAATARGSGSDGGGGGSSGEYTEDFEDVEEESGVVGGGSGDVDTVTDVEDAAGTTAGLGEDVEEVAEEVEEVVDEESILEEEPGGSSRSSGSSHSSGHYSEDFETESVRTQSHLRSHTRTASYLHRSSLVGSNSRSKIMSGNSFSGRSLLRRGSIVVPTLAPISGSDGTSRDDEEEGSPPQGARALSRVASIVKSSSGFKRTASISITMADDPLLPNQMARILPKTFSTNASGSSGGGLAAHHSSRRLSADGRGHHTPTHSAAAPTNAPSDSAVTVGSAQQEQQQQNHEQQHAVTPPGAYPPPYYPYPPLPYGSPYGMMPYPLYPAPAPAPAPSVASVLQYLPPAIPYIYSPYPNPSPVPAPPSIPVSPFLGPNAFAGGVAMGGAAAPFGGAATVGPPRPIGPMSVHSSHHSQHQQHNQQAQHILHGHGHHHVKFADGVSPGDGGGPSVSGAAATATSRPHPVVASAPSPDLSFGASAPAVGVGPHPSQQEQRPESHQAQQQQAYFGGIPTAGSFLGYGGYGGGSNSLFTAQSTLQRFGAVLGSGHFPGLDAGTVRTIRSDLVKTAAAISGQVGYEDIVAEAGAADEYRVQLARVKARLAAARAAMPSVIPSQEKVVLLRGAAPTGPTAPAEWHQKRTTTQQTQPGLGMSRVVGISTTAPGSYRYTTLEDTRRLIAATRPYTVVDVS